MNDVNQAIARLRIGVHHMKVARTLALVSIHTIPNDLIIMLADQILDRGGKLLDAMQEWKYSKKSDDEA